MDKSVSSERTGQDFQKIHSEGFLMRQMSSKRSRAWKVKYEPTDAKLTDYGSVTIAVRGSVLVVARGYDFGAKCATQRS